MTRECDFVCSLPSGLHARPASRLVELAERFSSEIVLENKRAGKKGDAKSVLSLVAAGFNHQDQGRLIVTGSDEVAAYEALRHCLLVELPRGAAAVAPAPLTPEAVVLPPSLAAAEVACYPGRRLVRGVGRGCALFIDSLTLPDGGQFSATGGPDEELDKVHQAIRSLQAKIEHTLAGETTDDEAEILKTHIFLARDSQLLAQIQQKISANGCPAGRALVEAANYFTDALQETQSDLLQERILDVQDVCAQLLIEIYGDEVSFPEPRLEQPSIGIADNLTPGQLIALDRNLLKGLVLGHAGATSHTAILARSFNIPTLTGVKDVRQQISGGREVIVDANLGVLVSDLSEPVERYYRQEQRKHTRKRQRLLKHADQAATTKDGHRIETAANVASPEEAAALAGNGAEGVGLFRTEMLFMESSQPPSEEEQFQVYRRTLELAEGRSVIFRTIDAGGDKPLPCLQLPPEANPFLGYRGVRVYPEFRQLFIAQLRALVRASAFGDARIMPPLICCLDELRWVKNELAEIQAEFQRRGIEHRERMPVGVMVETPAAAFLIDQLAAEVDFFSIGTNDLLQYFLGVDRDNEKVSALHNPLHPSFLRLLMLIVKSARRCGKWVGLCGEMAGSAACLPLLVGLGLDELSMSQSRILEIKDAIRGLSQKECAQLLADAANSKNIEEVDALLAKFQKRDLGLPVLEQNLIACASASLSKQEAIKEAVDNLYVVGRTDRPELVEQAVWAREAQGETDFGHGFAIPHCKTDELKASSLCIVKLDQPVAWGSPEGELVRCVIMLAIKESDPADTHLRIFSTLARKVMHEEFRAGLLAETEPSGMLAFLKENLSL